MPYSFAGSDYRLVPYGTARLDRCTHPAGVGLVDIITEREETV